MSKSVYKYIVVSLCLGGIFGLAWLYRDRSFNFSWSVTTLDKHIRRSPQSHLARNDSDVSLNFSNVSYVLLDWGPAYWRKNNNLTDNDIVNNCIVTRDRARLSEAHAVLMDIREVRSNDDIPQQRHPWQLWVFMNVESPYHAILEYPQTKLKTFKGDKAFNWTMTYRQDSDVVIWYGRKLPLKAHDAIENEELRKAFRRKTKFLTGSASNCDHIPNHRDIWFKELMKLDSEVHIYGSCGNSGGCPGYLNVPGCDKTQNYKFFLAFENSNCRDYITEKFWWNGFHYTAIPVVMGAPKSDILNIAPDHSFIHVDDFVSPRELLKFLHELADNEEEFLKYLQWRHSYSIEVHFRQLGNFGWELLCDAMNSKYNSSEAHSYHDISEWISPETDCTQHSWIEKNLHDHEP